MEIIILLFILGAIGLIVWGIMISGQGPRLRLPKDNIKANRPGFDFSKVLPSEGLLNKLKMSAGIKNNLTAAHSRMSPAAFFNIKILAEQIIFPV